MPGTDTEVLKAHVASLRGQVRFSSGRLVYTRNLSTAGARVSVLDATNIAPSLSHCPLLSTFSRDCRRKRFAPAKWAAFLLRAPTAHSWQDSWCTKAGAQSCCGLCAQSATILCPYIAAILKMRAAARTDHGVLCFLLQESVAVTAVLPRLHDQRGATCAHQPQLVIDKSKAHT